MTTATILENKSPAYIEGFKIGLMIVEMSKYCRSNPYDKRKQTGKDWSQGNEDGISYRCENGYQAANELRLSL